MKNAEYQVKTNKTTPYWNCPTKVLESKVEAITKMIEKVSTISGDQLDYCEATYLTGLLQELRRCVEAQVEDRKREVE